MERTEIINKLKEIKSADLFGGIYTEYAEIGLRVGKRIIFIQRFNRWEEEQYDGYTMKNWFYNVLSDVEDINFIDDIIYNVIGEVVSRNEYWNLQKIISEMMRTKHIIRDDEVQTKLFE